MIKHQENFRNEFRYIFFYICSAHFLFSGFWSNNRYVVEVIRHRIFTRIYAHLNVCTTVQMLLVPKICIKIDSFVNLLLETII